MGKLYIVGIGPGDEKTLTGAARQALDACDCICGYTLYVELLRPLYPEKQTYTTGMTGELERCRECLRRAEAGETVALVCSGDAGVYGMAGPALELLPEYPGAEIEIVPGVTAALSGGAGRAAGARLLRDLPLGSADGLGSDRKAPAACRAGGLRRLPV